VAVLLVVPVRIPRRIDAPRGISPVWWCQAGSHAAVVRPRPAGHHQPGL